MELESPIEWLNRQGYHIIKTKSGFWFDMGPKVYQAFPYHKLITPTNDEIENFFNQSKAIAIRYSVPINYPIGRLSYHVIYDREDYELDDLPKKARHDVMKGLQYASYGVIPLVELAKQGWHLYEETLIRQGRKNALSSNYWEALCLSADGLPCFEAWGALHEGALVTSLLACTIDDTVSILFQQSLTEHQKYGINNALIYTFTREVLSRPGIKCIFYGLHSLDAPASVDNFKFRMRYRAKPVRQRVVFNPSIAPFIQPLSYSLLRALMRILPANPRISKVEGMMRFYLNGKRPLTEQEWPDILQEQKETILEMGR
jgi:hypothetical protein